MNFSITTELQYTSAIFQLALGVNGIFAVLIDNFFRVRRHVLDDFAVKVKQHDPNSALAQKGRYLGKVIYRSMPGYRLFYRFFVTTIVVAAVSGMGSFYYLLKAALHPNETISEAYLAAIAIILLILNPALYFAFYRASEWFLSVVRSRLAVSPEYAISIQLNTFLAEENEKIDEAILDLELFRWKHRIQSLHISMSYTLRRISCTLRQIWYDIRRLWHKESQEEINEFWKEVDKLLREVPKDEPPK